MQYASKSLVSPKTKAENQNVKKLADPDLVELCHALPKGDNTAFDEVFSRHYSFIKERAEIHAKQHGSFTAEDIVQEVSKKIILAFRRKRKKPINSIRAYLEVAIRNTVRNFEKKYHELPDDYHQNSELAEDAYSWEENDAEEHIAILKNVLDRAQKKLKKKKKEIIKLIRAGHTNKAIQQRLNKKTRTATKQAIYYAKKDYRKKIRTELKNELQNSKISSTVKNIFNIYLNRLESRMKKNKNRNNIKKQNKNTRKPRVDTKKII